ncbi:nitrite reductase small subunit NirD [Serratia ficaria]|uniref:Nitrite reductase (NADH) small subunit n=1 Tax=Serratia ficaria TaxID=61651 RepID=A0A240CDV1_SERFI|nr:MULTISPECIES: nitrite reductase small subunit NirD [Serratia]MEE4485056.1 nitrite reductase small subunit NirD [Serratia ficaria]REF42259.1 assimilatory nitrite reductase (NAD(P)H) small subunit [Serratia ficaria]CAI0969175.1 Nitrite reductase [NAD(P)H] small subunit [Serratia ficaria]CAI0978981.1 Nitrite reductase [NAD(P)H] small subunit [Serratia ficaria]CAI1140362.1 Nitrite reductase [NAD(P)H] small subunit [Serratia ficaria]
MSQWITVCPVADILPGTGVCALIGDRQVAVFRPYADERVFAISNIDPFAQASVLSRGLIAEHQGELWIASPLKKQHFRLNDGHCLEDGAHSIASFTSRVVDGLVQIAA